jgi:1-acyl-sn-glycerol-3-phosphate acyltransferase
VAVIKKSVGKEKIMKMIWGYIRIVLTLLVLTPWLMVVIPTLFIGRLVLGSGEHMWRYGFKTLSWMCRFLLEVGAGVKTTVSGAENIPKNSGCLFMSNHQSFSDILLCYGYINRPMAMVAKKELGWFFPTNVWMFATDCYLLDRKNPRQAIPLFEKASRNMQAGYATLIYPEGTRSRGPKNKDFIVGSVRLAYQAKCAVVPVTINGGWKAHDFIIGKRKDKRCHITIHPAIDPMSYPMQQKKLLVQTVQKAVEAGFTIENER